MNNKIENESFPKISHEGDGEGVSQESLLRIAYRHRWIILSTTMLFLLAAFIYILKTTPIYRSTSRLYVEEIGPRVLGDYDGGMAGRSNSYLYTQAELLKSIPITGEVLNDPLVKGFKTFSNMDNPAAYLKNNLQTDIGKKDDILSISFDSPYPEESASIVNRVTDSYIKYHSAYKQTTVSKVIQILQKEKKERDEELSNKYKEIVQFTRTHGVVSFDGKGGDIVFQQLVGISQALSKSQLETINAKTDYQIVMSIADDPVKVKQFASTVPSAGYRALIQETEIQLESELRKAEIGLKNTKYHVTADHPAIKAINTKIDHLKKDLQAERKKFADKYIELAAQRWHAAQQKEKILLASFKDQHRQAQDLGVVMAEYSMLQSELKRSERICEILDDRIKELNVTEDTGALNISILEVARPALGPSKPQKSRIMAMALVLGFMVGGGLALVRDLMDVRLRSADEIEALLGISILGTVPRMPELQWITGRSKRTWADFKPIISGVYRKVQMAVYSCMGKEASSMSNVANRGKFVLDSERVISCGQKVHFDPKSIAAEAYRTVRTSLFFGVPKGEAATILITSPDSGDGKSTLASNLAITIAQAGQKTLIVDADFRRPIQHNIFDLENSRGLSNVIAGTLSLEEVIHHSPIEGLDILSCGSEVPNPSEMLNSDIFSKILKTELYAQYDRIIVDSPPVGPVTDSQILAAICDVTLLVLRAEKSTRRQSQNARNILLGVGGRLLGAVVNDVPQRHGMYGYDYGYGYHSGSAYYSDHEQIEAAGA